MNFKFSGKIWFWKGPLSRLFRYRSGKAMPQPEGHIGVSDLWLGNDPGICSDRGNLVADILAPTAGATQEKDCF